MTDEQILEAALSRFRSNFDVLGLECPTIPPDTAEQYAFFMRGYRAAADGLGHEPIDAQIEAETLLWLAGFVHGRATGPGVLQ